MADNLKVLKQNLDLAIDPNAEPGGIKAQDHNDVFTEFINKAGKYTGMPYRSNKEVANNIFVPGDFSWNSNNFRTLTNFQITFAQKSFDLNDLKHVLSTMTDGSVIRFKDYVGRSVMLRFVSYIQDLDDNDNIIYHVTVKGYSDNINYSYQENETEFCMFDFYSLAKDNPFIDNRYNTRVFPLSLYNIDVNKPELDYIFDAILEYAPWNVSVGERMEFVTSTVIGDSQDNYGVLKRYYKIAKNIQNIPSGLSNAPDIDLLAEDILPRGDIEPILEETNPDAFLIVGDLGGLSIDEKFNQGEFNGVGYDAWEVNREKIIVGFIDGVKTYWLFLATQDQYGFYGGDDIDDPEILSATPDMFSNLNDQPGTITDTYPIVEGVYSDKVLSPTDNKKYFEVNYDDSAGEGNEVPINITIEDDSTVLIPTNTSMTFFQTDPSYVPTITKGSGVNVLMEENDSLVFTGVNKGFQLVKVKTNTWRLTRINDTIGIINVFGNPFSFRKNPANNDATKKRTLEVNDFILNGVRDNTTIWLAAIYTGAGVDENDDASWHVIQRVKSIPLI